MIEKYCRDRDFRVGPYASFMEEESWMKAVKITNESDTAIDENALKKLERSITDLNMDNTMKANVKRMSIKELAPTQRYVIPCIEEKKNMIISYDQHCGTKTGILLGTILRIQKIKESMKKEERKRGPIAIILMKSNDRTTRKKELKNKLHQLTHGTSVSFGFNNPAKMTDILLLSVRLFFASPEPLDFKDLDIFGVLDANDVFTEIDTRYFFVNYLSNTIDSNVTKIIYMNNFHHERRSQYYQVVHGKGCLFVRNPVGPDYVPRFNNHRRNNGYRGNRRNGFDRRMNNGKDELDGKPHNGFDVKAGPDGNMHNGFDGKAGPNGKMHNGFDKKPEPDGKPHNGFDEKPKNGLVGKLYNGFADKRNN